MTNTPASGYQVFVYEHWDGYNKSSEFYSSLQEAIIAAEQVAESALTYVDSEQDYDPDSLYKRYMIYGDSVVIMCVMTSKAALEFHWPAYVYRRCMQITSNRKITIQ